ncbi:MAG TPA: helix-hairpin-helix domain-containing protein [Candidatus Cloacimonas sp.]|nr:helix-hairpin-helix domain-containing protein [Candidatus Cloacimonas sp.]
MKLKNPLRNFLTPDEQKMLLFLGLIILCGCFLDYFGWNPLQASSTDLDSLKQVVKEDKPLQLDIRIATFEELLCLSGIGEKRAKDIIAYRETNPFTSVNQIMNIKGIGAKTYAKILPDLLAFGDTTNFKLNPTPSSTSKTKSATPNKANNTTIININTANLEELCTLSGIGEVKAQAIIDWRKENGSFANIEDLMKVKGIGPKTLEKNKDRLTVE